MYVIAYLMYSTNIRKSIREHFKCLLPCESIVTYLSFQIGDQFLGVGGNVMNTACYYY